MPGKRILRILNAIIFSSIQEIFLILSFGLAFDIIYLIGDTRQLYPLLEGLITGAVFFALLSTLFGRDTNKRIIVFAVASAVLLLISFMISYLFHLGFGYGIQNDLLFVLGIGVSSVILPVQQYTYRIFLIENKATKGLTSGTSSIAMIIGIVVFSVIYERAGQIMLPRMVEELGAIAIVLTIFEALFLPT
ncbi:MAG: hypothetical protein QXR21_06200 [Thermoplasmatales archaeon]